MKVVQFVKGLFASESDSDGVEMYQCNGCSNVFTKPAVEADEPRSVRCPNCESTDVELAVGA